jgi:hypothetical protein
LCKDFTKISHFVKHTMRPAHGRNPWPPLPISALSGTFAALHQTIFKSENKAAAERADRR